jgi:dephospho-CoA kinase
MVIIGLTGSIAMGKSTAALMLRRLKLPVYDADATVHRLLEPNGEAFALVQTLFPEVVQSGVIDRLALGKRVFANPNSITQLESVVHPFVHRLCHQFLQRVTRERRRIVVLDVPLLFETGISAECDVVIVITAPAFLQKQRALLRLGMTPVKFQQILARQVADSVKRFWADWCVPSGLGRATTIRRFKYLLNLIHAKHKKKLSPYLLIRRQHLFPKSYTNRL